MPTTSRPRGLLLADSAGETAGRAAGGTGPQPCAPCAAPDTLPAGQRGQAEVTNQLKRLLPASGWSGSFHEEYKPCHSLRGTPVTRRPAHPHKLLSFSGAKAFPSAQRTRQERVLRWHSGHVPTRPQDAVGSSPLTCRWCPRAAAKLGHGIHSAGRGPSVSEDPVFPTLEIYECSLWRNGTGQKV